jgi:O-antigen/teichoic acid export membrane protein
LQAAGAFKPLAMASLWSSIGSIATVFVLILLVGPLWSIAGIIAGAAIYWGWTYRFATQWMRAFAQTGCDSRAADI